MLDREEIYQGNTSSYIKGQGNYEWNLPIWKIKKYVNSFVKMEWKSGKGYRRYYLRKIRRSKKCE